MYVILGPPVSIERIEAAQGIYPAHVWSYYGDREKGLPTHFSIVFFQRGGGGEFKLYDPVLSQSLTPNLLRASAVPKKSNPNSSGDAALFGFAIHVNSFVQY